MRVDVSDKFEKEYTLGKFILVLVSLILACKLLINFSFLWFPKLYTTDLLLIYPALGIVCVSLLIYIFFYSPMIRPIENQESVEVMMRDLAFNDILTGLYNFRGFMTFADKLLRLSDRTKRGLILIYADLDNLKRINDGYGHEAGDMTIVVIADVLKKTFRGSDIISRLGGDKFGILAVDAEEKNMETLRTRLKKNFESVNKRNPFLNLTISLGIIYYNPEKPQRAQDLLKHSDMLMGEEKHSKMILHRFVNL